MQKYKATGYLTLFDEEERQQRLSKIGMVDASFVLAPRQHNTPEENKQIKDKEGDGLWKDKPHKKCQKDTDLRTLPQHNSGVRTDGDTPFIFLL